MPTKTTAFDSLLAIKSGQSFTLRGHEYRATADATHEVRNGFTSVRIPASRRSQVMPSGWELSDVFETFASAH